MKVCCDETTRKKVMGAHYTPAWLADLVAEKMMQQIEQPVHVPLRVLDPACGDGVLLEALLKRMEQAGIPCAEACGVDAEGMVLEQAAAKLEGLHPTSIRLVHGDFLMLSTPGQMALWEQIPLAEMFREPFDAVIANPPYVRTQVLGTGKSRRLAERFRLRGKVDLYQAFLVAMTQVLRPGGVLGVITSNRFLTTDGAATIREFLATQYEVCEIIDLGDTKVFAAAVLPAVLIGKRRETVKRSGHLGAARFIKVYMESGTDGALESTPSASLGEVLSRGSAGTYQVPEGTLRVTTGQLSLGDDLRRVWSLASASEEEWVRRVRAGSAGVFGDVSHVRVGIKTTADRVFIRSDWHTLPEALQPEDPLLRPLLRHENAQRWRRRDEGERYRVLYPHEVSGGHRRAVDLSLYPKARAYLESHRDRLEKRRYVTQSGRQWYEIWVPHDPQAWAAPKIVFPDISPEPRFFLDCDGNVVDGDCYWIRLRAGIPPDLLYLLLAVSNSRLMTKFHDIVFNNRLYAGRRRYITQYVSRYPFPPPDTPTSREIVRLAKALVSEMSFPAPRADIEVVEDRLNALVEKAFGLTPGERP